MEIQQGIVLVTGHICSGKSSLSRALLDELSTSIGYVDIARVHDTYWDVFDDIGGVENRYRYTLQETFTTLYRGRSVIVEVLGTESWFSQLRRYLLEAWPLLIEVELRRKSLAKASRCLELRCQAGTSWGPPPGEEVYESEMVLIEKVYGQTFNPHAELFFTSGSIEAPLEFILGQLEKE